MELSFGKGVHTSEPKGIGPFERFQEQRRPLPLHPLRKATRSKQQEQQTKLCLLTYSSTLKMEAVCSFKISANFYQITWRHITYTSVDFLVYNSVFEIYICSL
jgi:hypothetical protein